MTPPSNIGHYVIPVLTRCQFLLLKCTYTAGFIYNVLGWEYMYRYFFVSESRHDILLDAKST